MLLLDRVIDYDPVKRTLTAQAALGNDSLFYDEALGGVPSYVAFELMAQSVAAFSGISDRLEGLEPKIGFILSVTNFAADVALFAQGETVTIAAREEQRVDRLFVFDCEAFAGEKRVASALLNVMNVDDWSEINARAAT
jgi:predicted hotdog family 3-hydroxylacyl-ACP dehydratase